MTTTKQQAMSIANSANAGASDTLLLLETKNGLLSGVLDAIKGIYLRPYCELETGGSGYIKSVSCEIRYERYQGEPDYPLTCTTKVTEEDAGRKHGFHIVDSGGDSCVSGYVYVHFIYAL